MKFVCGECEAKYQIPDERVAGRKLKIRCRKCGAAIHLRGEHASAVGEPAPAIEWHVAVDGQQHGPYPTEQMASMLRDGDLGWDASVWREGYGDWKDADVSDTLVRAVASIAETRHSAPPEARYSSHSIVPDYDDGEPTRMVHGGPADDELPTRMTHGAFPDDELPTRMVQQHSAPPADELQPYAHTAVARQRSVSPTSGVEPVRRPASVATSAGLAPARARRAQSYAPAEGLAPARRAQSYAPAEGLAAVHRPQSYAPSAGLAPVQARSISVAPSAQIAPVRAGYAGADGSGLIDIRALSALTHGNNQPSPMGATRTRSVAPSNMMVPMAAPNSPFGNIDSLRPFERPQRRSSKALPIAIVVGSSMVAAAAFLAVFMTRKEAAAVAAVELAAPPVAAAASALQPSEPQPGTAAAEAAPGTGQPEAALAAAVGAPEAEEPAAANEEEEADEPGESVKRSTSASATRSAKTKTSSKAAKKSGGAAKAKAADEKDDDLLAAREEKPAEAKAAPPAEKPAPEKASPSIDDLLAGNDKPEAVAATESKPKPAPPGSRSIDDLLDGAVAKKGSGSAATAPGAGGGNLPESPGRDEVKNAMQALESDVRGCADGQTLDSATATVAVTVTGSSGRVQSVRVTGNQGAVGSCIARVVRGAKFSPFSKPQFSFNFPYKLK